MGENCKDYFRGLYLCVACAKHNRYTIDTFRGYTIDTQEGCTIDTQEGTHQPTTGKVFTCTQISVIIKFHILQLFLGCL